MKRVIMLLLISGMGLALQAQSNRQERRAEIEARKKAYLKSEMQLSDEAFVAFEEVYNNHQSEKKALRKEMHQKQKAIKEKARASEGLENLNDDEIRSFLEARIIAKEAEAALERKYLDKYSKTVSMKQLATYYRAEKEFKKKLLRELKEERMERRQGMRERHRPMHDDVDILD